jgi:predicted transposase YbfD/YdcC
LHHPKKVDTKTNEITCVQPLLDGHDIKGKVVTLDAMHTQIDTANYLVKDKKADYLMTVKDNQKNLREDIAALEIEDRPFDYEETTPADHGRIETRRIWCSDEINDYVEFPHVSQVFCIERVRYHVKQDKTSCEKIYGITSQSKKKATAKDILQQNRGHWSIENKCHYILDVTYDEDRSQIRTGNGPEVMTRLRRFAISVLKIKGKTNIAQAFRVLWGKPRIVFDYLGIYAAKSTVAQ